MTAEAVQAVDVTWECSSTLGKFATALAAAQAEMGHAAKDSKNPHFNSRYADLASVRDASAPAAAHGIAITQMVITRPDGTPGLRTMLIHSSGEWMASNAWCKADKPGPQALGSVLTYLRRYMLAAALCIAQDDDDGNSATNDPRHPPRRDPPPTGDGRTFNGKETKSGGGLEKATAGAGGVIELASAQWLPRLNRALAGLRLGVEQAKTKGLTGKARQDLIKGYWLMYIGWACKRDVDAPSDLTDAEAATVIAKAEAGEVPSEAEADVEESA